VQELPCKTAGCPGHVLYAPEVATGTFLASSTKVSKQNTEKVYLECDGPERHWNAYWVPVPEVE
jgi:hypothetical protein